MMSALLAQKLMSDPRIQEAKALLLGTLRDTIHQMHGVRPAQTEKKKSYQELIDAFSELRGAKLFYPYIGSGLGRGPLVELLDGSVKYDMISGIGTHLFGHSYLPLTEKMIEAALSDTVMQGNLQQNKESFELCRKLCQLSGLPHAFLTTSGAMANENALKLIFQKRAPRKRLLAFQNCFMGRTLALSNITDRPQYRKGLPETQEVDYIPFYDWRNPEGSLSVTLNALHEHRVRYPDAHACACLELIQGEGGIYTAPRSFFLGLIEALKRAGIVIFIDEVQTFGRTRSALATQTLELLPLVDVITIGKVSEVCATLFSESLKPEPGLISQTFISSTAALFAANFLLEEMEKINLFGPTGMIAQAEQVAFTRFRKWENHGLVTGPYGEGALWAFTAFEGNYERVMKFLHALFERGVIAFSAGSHPTRVRLLPPVAAMTHEDLQAAFDIIEETLITCSA